MDTASCFLVYEMQVSVGSGKEGMGGRTVESLASRWSFRKPLGPTMSRWRAGMQIIFHRIPRRDMVLGTV